MADAIGYALKLVLMIIARVIENKLEKKRLKEEFRIDMERFNHIAQSCLVKMLDDARKESEQAKKVEDAIDEARKGK